MDTTTQRRRKPLVTGPGYQAAPRGKAASRIDANKRAIRARLAARNREIDARLGDVAMAGRVPEVLRIPQCGRCQQPLVVEPVDVVSVMCSAWRATIHLACVLNGDELA